MAQCVRWYLAYSLSLRNLEEMMAERGIVVGHSTLHRWVIRLVPLLDKVFQTVLAGIKVVNMICKRQLKHSDGEGLSAAEQFYLLAVSKTGSATFADLPTLMRQSLL